MKYVKRMLVLLVFAVLLAGCASAKKEETTVFYLNFKPEVADVWEEIAEVYEAETGVKVKVLTPPSDSNERILKAEIAKRDAPTIFQISGPVAFKTWKNVCTDLSDTQLYSWLADKDMAITDGDGVYGIPYVVEGYGIIYNDAIMQKYFSLSSKGTPYKSMEEINNFQKLKAVVEDMTAHKSELGITGVFASTSLAEGETWRWQTHLANLPVYYEYKDKGVVDTDVLDFSYGKNYKNIFDLYVENSCTPKENLGTLTVNDSMQEFATGKCAMVQNGNWAWAQISAVENNVVKAEDCKFLPIYTGVAGEESQGICIGTECYICVNSMASEEQQKAAIAFLEWVYSSDVGKDFVTNKLEFITPFTTFAENETTSSPLAQEVLKYMNNESLTSVSWNFTSFPSQQFKDGLGEHLFLYCTGEIKFDVLESFVKETWKNEKAQ